MPAARCVEFSAALQVRVVRDALPQLAAGEVLVQTECSAISAGTELLAYRGQLPPDIALDDSIAALQRPVHYPLRYGYAAVGTVVACGSAVAREWEGRRVLAFHPHASHFIAQPQDLLPLPASFKPVILAMGENDAPLRQHIKSCQARKRHKRQQCGCEQAHNTLPKHRHALAQHRLAVVQQIHSSLHVGQQRSRSAAD